MSSVRDGGLRRDAVFIYATDVVTASSATSIPFLLGTRTGIPHILRYVSNTNHLKATFGEVRPEDNLILKEKEPKERNQPRRSKDEINR